jgi:hypothetical protein
MEPIFTLSPKECSHKVKIAPPREFPPKWSGLFPAKEGGIPTDCDLYREFQEARNWHAPLSPHTVVYGFQKGFAQSHPSTYIFSIFKGHH